MKPEDIILTMTCGACPEQYDAHVGDEYVGYLRLRHGWFTVTCPDFPGKDVYVARPDGDGVFMEDERSKYLSVAKIAICNFHNGTSAGPLRDEWREAVDRGETDSGYYEWLEKSR